MHRRHALSRLGRTAAAIALASLFGPPSAPRSAPVARPRFGGDDPFALGVASGMPRADSVVLWTRLAPQPHAPGGGLPPQPVVVHWELAEDEGFSRVVRSGTAIALPEHAHSVHIEVTSLPAGRHFHYRFHSGEARSPVGRTRTAPGAHEDVNRLRLALASCQHYEQGHYVAHREIATTDLDFVLFVGDYIYESSNPRLRLRTHEGPVPTTLDAYRRRHATYKLDPDLQAAHAAHPWVLTWDDHEVENDYTGDRGRHQTDPVRFLRQRAAAYKAYFEHLPVSPQQAPQGPHMRIHDHYAWGRLADLWTLDGRQYRSPQACPDVAGRPGGRVLGECAELDDPARTVFGTLQEAWLRDGMVRSDRPWKLVAQGSQISPWGVDTPLGRSVYSDAWDGYPQARERLMATLAQAGPGQVVTLGGDVHRHVVGQLRRRPNDPRSPVLATEFVTSSLTTRGLPEAAMAWIRHANPDLQYARSDERGYALIDVTPRALSCEFRGCRFPVLHDARLERQARHVVEAGHPQAQRDA